MAAPEPKELKPVDEIKQAFAKMQHQFKMALPPHVPVEKFLRVIFTAIQMKPELLQCDRQSLFAAATLAAQDGLLPDGREGAFVPYKPKNASVKSIRWQPMIRGILKLVRQSGEIATINALPVFQGDTFRYWIDDNGEHILYEPVEEDRQGPRIKAFAFAKTKDGELNVEVMSENQIEAVRNSSAAADTGPWAGDFQDEMVRKTVLRRLTKRLPMSTDVERIFDRDNDLYDFAKNLKTITSGSAPEKKVGRLAKLIEGTSEKKVEATTPTVIEGAGGEKPEQEEFEP